MWLSRQVQYISLKIYHWLLDLGALARFHLTAPYTTPSSNHWQIYAISHLDKLDSTDQGRVLGWCNGQHTSLLGTVHGRPCMCKLCSHSLSKLRSRYRDHQSPIRNLERWLNATSTLRSWPKYIEQYIGNNTVWMNEMNVTAGSGLDSLLQNKFLICICLLLNVACYGLDHIKWMLQQSFIHDD